VSEEFPANLLLQLLKNISNSNSAQKIILSTRIAENITIEDVVLYWICNFLKYIFINMNSFYWFRAM